MIITVQSIGGPKHRVTVDAAPLLVKDLAALLPAGLLSDQVKLVHRGTAFPCGLGEAKLDVRDGDTLLLMPERKRPVQEKVAAAVASTSGRGRGRGSNDDDDDDDDDDKPFSIPSDAARWERALGLWLKQRLGWSDLALEWLFVLRPRRLLLALVVFALMPVSSRLGLGPVFILCSIIAAILLNLGSRRAGEASAYSIFNPGVRRLPGELDMDQIDQQIRRGQAM